VRLDRLPVALVRAARRLRRRLAEGPRPPRRPRIAGVLPVRDYRPGQSAFAALRRLSDVTIVLDDSSREPFPHREECDEYLRLEHRGPWNDQANRTLLLYRAFVHGCDWVLFVEDDLVFGSTFQTREDAARLAAELEARGREVVRFPFRELWDSRERWRADGPFGRKSIAVMRRNWFAYERITLKDPGLRLHTAPHPANLRQRLLVDDRHVAYHTACLTRADREARVAKYRLEDPRNRFQRDYDYLVDERGLELRPVPPADVAVLEAAAREGS
jgi:hypothetical protein